MNLYLKAKGFDQTQVDVTMAWGGLEVSCVRAR